MATKTKKSMVLLEISKIRNMAHLLDQDCAIYDVKFPYKFTQEILNSCSIIDNLLKK